MKKMSVLLVLPALLFSACGNNGTVSSNGVSAVSGTVVEDATPEGALKLVTKPWTGGAGTVTATVGESATQVASGTLNANGSFNLSLPGSVPDAALVAVGNDFAHIIDDGNTCTGPHRVSDPNARLVGLDVTAKGTKQGTISPFTADGQVNTQAGTSVLNASAGYVVYADRALTLTAQETCTGDVQGRPGTTTLIFDLKLARGWNLLTLTNNFTVSASKATAQVSVTSGRLPTNNWLFGGSYGSLSVPHALNLQ